MPASTVQNIDESSLSTEERHALAILRNLPVDTLNLLKQKMSLGSPGIIGPQTLTAFRQLCSSEGLDLSDAGVQAFKAAHHLGDAGDQKGVIGPQTAAVYFDEITRQKPAGQAAGSKTVNSPSANGRSDNGPSAEGGRRPFEQILLMITGQFEGRGFTNLTGNFDGQGISFGILQWNFGQNTLAPLLKLMAQRDAARFRAICGSDTDSFLTILNGSHDGQMAFARRINDGKDRVVEPWRSRFVHLGEYPPFQHVQGEFAAPLIDKAKKLATAYGLKTQRGVALMFDIVVQNGTIGPAVRQKILQAKEEKERSLGRPLTEREYLEVIAEKRAAAARAQFRADVLARKLCIVRGSGQVHGQLLNLDEMCGLSDDAWA